MRRVLMISPHFPPDSTAGTHRVRLLAPHLQAHGWEPTVLTVDPRDYEGRLDPALAASVPPDLRVVRCRAWPASRTRPFGIGDLGLRALRGLEVASVELMSRETFDALFITIYPTYPALLGPWLKKRFGVPFVLDYQDPWVGEWGRSVGAGANGHADLKSRATRALARRLEPIALGAADAVTAVSRATFEQALARNPNAKPVTTAELPIGWDARDLEWLQQYRTRRATAASAAEFRLSYVGTLLPTGLDTVRTFFAGIARFRRQTPALAERLRVRFVGTSNQRSSDVPRTVAPIAHQFGLDHIVAEEPERLDYFDALDTLASSDGVLLLGSREPHYTPSKVFPALLSERPLLALLHEASTAVDLLRRAGGPPWIRTVTYGNGKSGDNVGIVAEHLREMLASRVNGAPRVDRETLASTSACVLARTLARVLDTVSSRKSQVSSRKSATRSRSAALSDS